MKDFRVYIRENSGWLTVNLFLALVMTATMLLNGIPAYEIGYGMLLCVFVTVAAAVIGFGRHRESIRQLKEMRKNIAVVQNEMKVPEYLYETYYQDCINVLVQEKDRVKNELMTRQQDMTAYYSMWVHQIKTPIAALKLLIDEEVSTYLEADHTEENDIYVINSRQMQSELFRIEQYVDMALQYIRLGAGTNDFVFERVMLDEVIKTSIHKYAKQFIQKQLRLVYTPQELVAVTDKKWLGFVIDQLLSNAVKYTKQGSVTIRVCGAIQPCDCAGCDNAEKTAGQNHWNDERAVTYENSVRLVIEDTGIGIRAEDLPRVCEKGYTGYNGHADKYSTGIGLYLCRSILDKLGHRFHIASEQGNGTKVEIVMDSIKKV
ncbi:MAG: sensor histidine kinase [Lachnospiraceae bacterium]|nr:sensor histidine kinase [Lachnospiraceae bacterium]